MPKGEKLIIWTEANETKLLHAILAVHDIKLDYPKIAALFGMCSFDCSFEYGPPGHYCWRMLLCEASTKIPITHHCFFTRSARDLYVLVLDSRR